MILFSEVAAYHARHAGAEDGYRTSIREFVELSRRYTAVDAYLRAQRERSRRDGRVGAMVLRAQRRRRARAHDEMHRTDRVGRDTTAAAWEGTAIR